MTYIMLREISEEPIKTFNELLSGSCLLLGLLVYIAKTIMTYIMKKQNPYPDVDGIITPVDVIDIEQRRLKRISNIEQNNRIKVNRKIEDDYLNGSKSKIKKELISKDFKKQLKSKGYKVKREWKASCMKATKTAYYIIEFIDKGMNLV